MNGKRYEKEPKLNIKKVIGAVVAIAVIIMFVITLTKLLKDGENAPKTKDLEISYFAVYTQNKWGVIDSNGNTVIEPTHDEMILIPNNKTPIFLCTYDVDYENNTYKTKAIDEKGKDILTGYNSVEAISNKNSNGQMWYEKNIYKVSKDGKYGLINGKGKEVLECNYNEIIALQGLKEHMLITRDDKKGVCDIYGNIIVNTEYKDIQTLGEGNQKEFIVQNAEGKYGIVESNKTTILPTEYEEISQVMARELYVVKQNGKWAIINKDKSINIVDKFDEVKSINDTNIIIKKDNKYGIITTAAEEKVPTKYDELSYVFGENYIAKKDNKYGIINLSDETKLEFNYNELTYNKEIDIILGEKDNELDSDIINNNFEIKTKGILSKVDIDKGYIRIRENGEYKYYNFKFEEKKNTEVLTKNTIFLDKKDGKYGYINNRGEVVVDYQYDDATEQNEYGFASVNKDGKWGSIDKDGKILAETTNDLTNNQVIDFIGKWHLGVDATANYYTDI